MDNRQEELEFLKKITNKKETGVSLERIVSLV